MFTYLIDLDYKRTPTQAVGFYLSYLVLFILSGGLLAGIVSAATNSEVLLEASLRIINVLVVLAILTLSTLIVREKGHLKQISYLFVILVAGILAILGGGILGLIPAAYLTTLPVKKSTSETKHHSTQPAELKIS